MNVEKNNHPSITEDLETHPDENQDALLIEETLENTEAPQFWESQQNNEQSTASPIEDKADPDANNPPMLELFSAASSPTNMLTAQELHEKEKAEFLKKDLALKKQNPLLTELMRAGYLRNAAKIKALLAAGANPNERLPSSAPTEGGDLIVPDNHSLKLPGSSVLALVVAAANGAYLKEEKAQYDKIISMLLEAGADPLLPLAATPAGSLYLNQPATKKSKKTDASLFQEGDTLIEMAIKTNNSKLLVTLLDHYPPHQNHLPSNKGMTCLMLAVLYGQVEIVETLLRTFARIRRKIECENKPNGETVLLAAVKLTAKNRNADNARIISILLEYGANPTYKCLSSRVLYPSESPLSCVRSLTSKVSESSDMPFIKQQLEDAAKHVPKKPFLQQLSSFFCLPVKESAQENNTTSTTRSTDFPGAANTTFTSSMNLSHSALFSMENPSPSPSIPSNIPTKTTTSAKSANTTDAEENGNELSDHTKVQDFRENENALAGSWK